MFKRAIITTCIVAILSGCGAEDRPYDTYERAAEEITVKSLDTESLWMFMPSTTETPRYAMTQRGFFQGDPKLVTLRFDKNNGIYAEEVDRDKVTADADSRWDSDINRAPVLKIPGEFRQYRCAENSYGECTNKEEINRDEDLDWKEATHFVPKYEDIKSLSEDTLSAWFTATNVTETAEPRLISYEYNPEEGVINVELERTFTASPEDQYQFGNDMRDLSFKTRFFYSLVKLDKLASKDYEPVYYQGQDSAYFGFFNDHKEVKTHTGESNIQGSNFAYLNRFNPNKESIDYYLSDSYFDADVEDYRQLTLDTISQVNATLKGTGVPAIRIVNPTKKAGVRTGDLRYNVFNLIADPVDNGLLGYGPSATNPLTGEIIHAHVNQYLGVIRSTSRHYWNDLAMRYNRQEIAKVEPVVKIEPVESSGSSEPLVEGLETDEDVINRMIAEERTPAPYVPNLSENQIRYVLKGKLTDTLPKADYDFKYDTDNKDLALQSFYKHKEMQRLFSEQNAYSVESMWVSTQAKGLVKGIDYSADGFFTSADQTALKQWDDLTLEQQKLASKAISKHMFKSTLIHELGHNLGLRHNFMGSVDKANFYTQEELNAKGVEDKPAAYSSIMDYGASIFDELLTYGKYDKAALRFGYARELETTEFMDTDSENTVLRDSTGAQKRKVVSLAKYDEAMSRDYNAYPTGVVSYLRRNTAAEDIKAPLMSYRYCTDEHTTTDLLCDRFDEGTNLSEVTEFRIQRYKDSYETMNKRNGRDSFYQFHQYNYFLSRWGEFQSIRDIIENAGEIDYMFARYIGADTTNNHGAVFTELAQKNGNCVDGSLNPLDPNDVSAGLRPICDTYKAANLAADFFLDILRTPDKVCEVKAINGDAEDPGAHRFMLLSDLWKSNQFSMSQDRDIPTSCFDDELAEILANEMGMEVRSETRDGKIWASLKANNPYQTSSSAVDMLGIWPDKLLAAQMLVRRDTPNMATENSSLALIDMPHKNSDKAEELYNHLKKLIGKFEQGVRQDIFVDKNGHHVETVNEYKQALTTTIEATPSYLWPMKRYFNIGGDDAFSYWTEGAYQDTTVPYFGTLLSNLDKYSNARGYGLNDSAQRLQDDIHINLASSSYANSSRDDKFDVNFAWKGKKYSVNYRNRLAQALARQALYTNEQQERFANLNNALPGVKEAIDKFRTARDINQARIIAIGDKEALNAMKEAENMARMMIFEQNPPPFFAKYKQFEEYDVDGKKCLRFIKEGESEEERLKRKCNSLQNLYNVNMTSLRVFEDFSDKFHEQMFNVAQEFGDKISENAVEKANDLAKLQQNISDAKDQAAIDEATEKYNTTKAMYEASEKVYDYDPEELRLWSSDDYADYRRAFEQFPVYDD